MNKKETFTKLALPLAIAILLPACGGSDDNDVKDTSAPIITLNGEPSVTMTVGDTYTEAGATAQDNVDGTVTVTNNSSTSVDTTTAGTYTVTYTATDAAGNTATATRTVVVETAQTSNFDAGLLSNGDFFDANSDAWIGNAASIQDDGTGSNNVNYANVETAGNPWDVNLSQVVAITQGATYQLTFKAKSDVARTLVAGIGLNEDPWTNNTQEVNLTTEWQDFSLEFTASGFGSDNSRVIFDMGGAAGEVVIDDVTLNETQPTQNDATAPTDSAAVPTRLATDVIAIYSDTYTTVSDVNTNPAWGQTTVVSTVDINGNQVLKYSTLNYQGTEYPTQNVNCMSGIHFDYWTADATGFNFSLIGGGAETAHNVVATTGSWQAVDVPLSTFTNPDLSQVIQFKFDDASSGEAATIYLDNLYFYNEAGEGNTCSAPDADPEPTTAATNPTHTIVASMLTGSNDVTVNWSTDWDNADVADVQIEGNDVKKYTNLTFAGIEPAATIDASSATHISLDIWTPNEVTDSEALRIKLVDFGADGAYQGGDDTEHELVLNNTSTPALASQQWVTLNIPLSSFTGMTSTGHIAQMIISRGTNSAIRTLYVDNVFFH